MGLENIKNKIDEYDMNAGLACCAGDEEFYVEMLGDYVNSGKDISLARCFDEKDWKNYEIDVHSLKSTSRMMGFPALGDICEELQYAAEAENEALLLEKHPVMMENFSKILEAIREEIG